MQTLMYALVFKKFWKDMVIGFPLHDPAK